MESNFAVLEAERDGTGAQQQAANTASMAFPTRLHLLLTDLEDTGESHIAGFQPHGRSFKVHKLDAFVTSVLPNWFRQSKYTSFQRQLNIYGFTRITSGPDMNGYYHKKFLRGSLDLTREIVRVATKGTGNRQAESRTPNFYDVARPPEASGQTSEMAPVEPRLKSVPTNDLTTDLASSPQPITARAFEDVTARLYPELSTVDFARHEFQRPSRSLNNAPYRVGAADIPSQSGTLFQGEIPLDMRHRRGSAQELRHVSQADPPLRRSDPYLSILQGLEPLTGDTTRDLAYARLGESNRLQPGLARQPEESIVDRLTPWRDLRSTYHPGSVDPIFQGLLPTAGQSRFPPPESLAAHVAHPRDPWSLASLEFATVGRSSRPAASLFQQSLLDQPLRSLGSTYRPGTVDPILQGLLPTTSQIRFPPPEPLTARAAYQIDPWSLASLEFAAGRQSSRPAASLFQQSLLDQPILDYGVSNFAHANSATPRQQTLPQASVPTEATGNTGRYNGDMFPLGPVLGAPLRTSNEEIVYNDLIRSLLRSRAEQGDASFDLDALMAHLRSGPHR